MKDEILALRKVPRVRPFRGGTNSSFFAKAGLPWLRETVMMTHMFISKKWLSASLRMGALAAGAALTSCAVSLPTHPIGATQGPPLYDWHGDGLQGPTSVKIHLDEQKAYIFRGGQEAGWTTLASGKIGHDSPRGDFTVMEKLEQKSSNTYGVIMDGNGNVVNGDAQAGVTRVPAGCHFVGASMPHWMRLTSWGVGMHAGMIPQPGMPASHGCIRLPPAMAAKLFEVLSPGSSVIVTGIAPGSALAGAPPALAPGTPAAPPKEQFVEKMPMAPKVPLQNQLAQR